MPENVGDFSAVAASADNYNSLQIESGSFAHSSRETQVRNHMRESV
jgi:hypothetical protein